TVSWWIASAADHPPCDRSSTRAAAALRGLRSNPTVEDTMRARGSLSIAVVASVVALVPAVTLADTLVTPLKGQTPEQIQRDQAECHSIAASSATAPAAQPAPAGRPAG